MKDDPLARRHALLAALILDPELEASLRRDPEGFAASHDQPADFVNTLARLSPARVAAFRRSREHKQALRDGNHKPRRE